VNHWQPLQQLNEHRRRLGLGPSRNLIGSSVYNNPAIRDVPNFFEEECKRTYNPTILDAKIPVAGQQGHMPPGRSLITFTWQVPIDFDASLRRG
jgi:hypothetical protein